MTNETLEERIKHLKLVYKHRTDTCQGETDIVKYANEVIDELLAENKQLINNIEK